MVAGGGRSKEGDDGGASGRAELVSDRWGKEEGGDDDRAHNQINIWALLWRTVRNFLGVTLRLSPPSLEMIDTEVLNELITLSQVYSISSNGGECLGGDKHAVCLANKRCIVSEAPHRHECPPSNVHL